jgi:hypothetical protein
MARRYHEARLSSRIGAKGGGLSTSHSAGLTWHASAGRAKGLYRTHYDFHLEIMGKPAKFWLVLNLETTRRLGLNAAQALQMRADQPIE